jgi:hypothetical protein
MGNSREIFFCSVILTAAVYREPEKWVMQVAEAERHYDAGFLAV